MTKNFIHIHRWLYPLAWLYGAGVCLRNRLFDAGILHEQSFPLPVICIGNLTVGGTGKTPHTEYLIRLLTQAGYQTGVLSRGYKRKSKGFQWANPNTPMEQIGDEPYQMKSKYPAISLAVDADRPHGIACMTAPDVHPTIDVILLDDAYQHRYVKAGLNLLLTDYHRPIYEDALLPAGRLREPLSGKKRADVIVVSKCPPDLCAEEAGQIRSKLQLDKGQELYFSTLKYGDLRPFDPSSGATVHSLQELTPDKPVILLTGIATPEKLRLDLQHYTSNIRMVCFPDHHQFTDEDAAHISRQYAQASEKADVWIITTEKDATRLQGIPLSQAIKSHLFILPVEVQILFEQEARLNQKILDYAGKHS